MIVHEEFMLGEKKMDFVRSDSRYVIERSDGKKLYEDLIEPGEFTYTETDEKIGEKQDYERAMRILLGLEA